MFKYFGLVMNFLPVMVAMMAQIEAANEDGKWTGEEKKQLVLSGLKAIVQGMLQISTGGQMSTWERIAPNLGGVIDNMVPILFPHED